MSTIVRPGSRPRGPITRPYHRTVNLNWLEHVAISRWADRHGLAVGGAIRQLVRMGLAADALTDERTDEESLAVLRMADILGGDPVETG